MEHLVALESGGEGGEALRQHVAGVGRGSGDGARPRGHEGGEPAGHRPELAAGEGLGQGGPVRLRDLPAGLAVVAVLDGSERALEIDAPRAIRPQAPRHVVELQVLLDRLDAGLGGVDPAEVQRGDPLPDQIAQPVVAEDAEAPFERRRLGVQLGAPQDDLSRGVGGVLRPPGHRHLGEAGDDGGEGPFRQIPPVEGGAGEPRGLGVSEARERLEALSREEPRTPREPLGEDGHVLMASVRPEVLGHEGRRRVVVVEEEIGDGRGGPLGVEVDEPIGRPVTDFRVLEPRETGQIFERPEGGRHGRESIPNPKGRKC
ncbi:MAG: hypothetical protein HY049_13310 [Acidobacteria bacterium]|nr:hypothetical protein [Acidobacteriota bacterium]